MSARSTRRSAWIAAVAAALWLAAPAGAVSESCREWREEHREWKVRSLHLFLTGASRESLDAAIFEMVQREAYLTSCPVSVSAARRELVGWRLVERPPDEYGNAVLESLLAQAGFELDLRRHFGATPVDSTARWAD